MCRMHNGHGVHKWNVWELCLKFFLQGMFFYLWLWMFDSEYLIMETI